MERFRCTHPDPCDEPARYYVWFRGCGGLYSYACARHLARWAVDGQASGYPVVQVTDCETQAVIVPLVRELM